MAEERVNSIPAPHLFPSILLYLSDGACKFKVLEDVTIETQHDLRCLFRFCEDFIPLAETAFLFTAGESEVIGILKGFQEYIALLKDSWRELCDGVVMRLARKVIISQTIDILEVRFFLPLVHARAFVI